MSRSEREARIAKDRLSPSALEPLRKTVQIISPTVTRRPALDSMLGDIATIGKSSLEGMRDSVLGGHKLDNEELGKFTQLSEGVFKQARLEMAVEKHIEERTGSMDSDDIASGVMQAIPRILSRFNLKPDIVSDITQALLLELGLDDA
jgi:hypothetical protein